METQHIFDVDKMKKIGEFQRSETGSKIAELKAQGWNEVLADYDGDICVSMNED